MKERINYVIEGKWYCGSAVNMPLIIQADSLDDLKRKTIVLAKSWLKHMTEIVEQEAFEFVEEKEEKFKNEN
jgi:hypothetical protein